MAFLSRSTFATAPRNLCELFLRDMTSLLITSRAITRSLLALRPECEQSTELHEFTNMLDRLVTTSKSGEARLRQPLSDAGIVLPTATDAGASTLVAGFFTRLPSHATPGMFATELLLNLRLMAQHVELRARLAAEEALLVGQRAIGRSLVTWAGEWHACSRNLRANSLQVHAKACVADVNETDAPVPSEQPGVA
jgi:hypothetical protein